MRSALNIKRARRVALALGAGALGSLALATPGMAAAPNAGTACQAADGKVNGRGATFATAAVKALADGYRLDVCGPVANDPDALTNMLAYNYSASAGFTGSGNGQKATSCRTDAFAVSDIPYDNATLAKLWDLPGTLGGCAITFTPPFAPNSGTYPGASDVTAKVMSFPIAGSSVAVAVRLTAADCGGTAPGALKLTVSTMSRIWGGEITAWNDPLLVADNPGLASCTATVTRVTRFDKSGTTQVFKNYLKNADGARVLCDGAETWDALALDAQNTNWPTGGGCSPQVTSGTSGASSQIAHVRTIPGGIAYADLADALAPGSPALSLPQIRNGLDTAFVTPGSSLSGANCDFTTTLPGSTNNTAVGLDPNDNWGIDSTTQHGDVTYAGAAYPICGMTYALVHVGLNGNSGANNAITGLSANQRRTLYSFFTYVMSPAAQGRLSGAKYAPLPNGFLTKLRLGFQGNF